MANIKPKKFTERVQAGADAWREYTKPMRQTRKRMLEHYAAGWYGSGTSSSQPLNLIDRGVQILGPYLVTNNPKVLVDAKRGLASHRPFANTLELALEHLFLEIKLAENTLRPAVINSLFSMGITKTGIMANHEIEIFGELHGIGQPYCDSVDFEDYIGDIGARVKEEQAIEGNVYLMPKWYILDSGLYKNYDRLTPAYEGRDTQTRPETISKKSLASWQYNELREMVELQDVWIPDEGIVITLPMTGQGTKIMRTVEWDGPEGGPYDILGYRCFPGSVIPIPPVYTWLDINKTINSLVAKMRDQAQREKSLILYDLGGADEVENVIKSPDQSAVGVRNVDSFKEIKLGGVHEDAYGFVQYLEQQYSVGAGNLYIIGGRGSQADTLGQEQMLAANASKQLDDMVQQVHNFTKSIVRKLAWYLWTDPLIEIPVIKRVGEISLPTKYTQDEREGDFLDYTFDIEPYSMSKMNPEMRYQRLMQLLSQLVLPTAQIAASQGSMLNVTEVITEAARFLDVRNIDRWWKSAVPAEVGMNPYEPQQEKGGQADGRLSSGQGEASNLNNMLQQQTRAGGQSSAPELGVTTKGL